MKWYSSPSTYRYCICRSSTWASSNFSPDRNVRSSTLPVRRLRILVRTKAPPFPGLTC